MRKLELEKKILAYYPMPNQELKSVLEECWLKYCKFLFLCCDQAIRVCYYVAVCIIVYF
jgi:hypothetical protein